MSHVVLFHHVLGLTPGVVSLATSLEQAGHRVTVPDLFNGETFTDLGDGLRLVNELGDDELLARAVNACQDLPTDLVYAGLSLGVFPAQHLLQSRPGARGGLFLNSFFDPEYVGGTWPATCPVHVYASDGDPFFVGDGDLQVAQAWQETHPNLDIHLYPGEGHLFMEPEMIDYDPKLTQVVVQDIIDTLGTME